MGAAPALNRAYMQMCWLVPDLEEAIAGWARTAGVGPFFWFDDVGATEGRHRGEPADFPTSTAAIAYAGDMQIELVCQENDEPGIFRDLFPRVSTACTTSPSSVRTTRRSATPTSPPAPKWPTRPSSAAVPAPVGSTRRPPSVFMVELLERSRARDMGFATMRAAAESWDGTNPITRF